MLLSLKCAIIYSLEVTTLRFNIVFPIPYLPIIMWAYIFIWLVLEKYFVLFEDCEAHKWLNRFMFMLENICKNK